MDDITKATPDSPAETAADISGKPPGDTISPAADQQQEGETPIKEKAAADDPGDRQRVIRIDLPEYDPELDPDSPDFNPGKWRAQSKEAAERLQETVQRTRDIMAAAVQPAIDATRIANALNGTLSEQNRHIIAAAAEPIKKATAAAYSPVIGAALQAVQMPSKAFAEAIRSPAIDALNSMTINTKDVLKGINKSIPATFTAMNDYFNSDAWQSLREALKEITATAPVLLELADEIAELSPYLKEELQKPEYEDKSIDDLLDEAETDENGDLSLTSLFVRAMNAARAARDADAAKKEPTHAAIKRADTVEYPLDKPNSIIWNLLEKDTKGQVTFNMAKYGSKQQIPAYYAINFDELDSDITITKRLLPFDKRAYIAVSALFNAGNNVITLSQIYYAMGNTGRPGTRDLTKINDAITKMTTARIFFDNEQEAAKYKYNRFKYDGSLLPLERGTAIVNGQLADAAIHIFREPPLITFAKQRKQITTVDVRLLQSPVSKTDANLLIDDYLIERISKAKNGKGRSCRILFKTLYDHAGIADKPKTNTEKQQKKRAPDKIKKYLTHYQKEEFITSFTMQKDGVTIHW